MLAMVAGLGALFAVILADRPVRDFFELEVLSAGQWFLALLASRSGSLAGAAWRLPYIQQLEVPEGAEPEPDDGPEPTHTPRTGEFDAVATPTAPTQRSPIEPMSAPADSPQDQDRLHDRPGHPHRSRAMLELIEAGADVFRLNFSHGTARGPRRERRDGARGGGADRQGDRDPRRPARAEAPPRRGRRTAIVDLRTGQRDHAHDRGRRSAAATPPGVLGRPPRGRRRGRPRLPRRRPHPPAGARGRRRRGPLRGRGRRPRSPRIRASTCPAPRSPLPAAGREDLAWVDFAIEHGIDLLAVSFVRRAEDLAPVERRIRTGGADIPVIAKIEKPQAAERAEEIVKAATAGIMVARGDLGIELPIEQVPGVQRRLLALAGPATRARRSPRPRCSPRWSPRRARPAPRSPTSPTRSTRAPTR